MKKIQRILEKKEVLSFLQSRKLVKQYRKAKRYLLQGHVLQVKFKERKPKGSEIWCFRINKQYRAIGGFDEEGNLVIAQIGDVH
jgi:plasmid maintenance system killer protein